MSIANGERAHAALWERLLAGDLTRVYVVSDLPRYVLVPHTLGLPVEALSDHLIDPRNGTRRPPGELRRIAQQRALADRWITGYGSADWDPPFITHAQAALILVSRSWRARQQAAAMRALAGDAARSLTRRDGNHFATEGARIDPPLETSGRKDHQYFRQISEHLESQYPDKTFVVCGRDLRQLHAVGPRPTLAEQAARLNPVGAFLLTHPPTAAGEAQRAGNRAERRGHGGAGTR